MATGFAAVRAGIVMFVLPFVFAFYPELLLIDAAKLDPAMATPSAIEFLPGYGPGIDWASLALVLARLSLCLYLLAGALARFDVRRMGGPETLLRIALAGAVMMREPGIWLPATGIALAYLAWHAMAAGRIRSRTA